MLEKILVPLNGRPDSEAILPVVRELALQAEGEMVLLRAIGFTMPPDGYLAGIQPEIWRDAHAYVGEKARSLRVAGLNVNTMVRGGRTAHAVLEAAEETDASLIAMTTHGRSGLDRWVHGSVAEAVVRRADVPVLLLRRDPDAKADDPPPKILKSQAARVILPVAGDGLAHLAKSSVFEACRALASHVTILHIAGPAADAARRRDADAERELEEMKSMLTASGVAAEVRILVGDPAERIDYTARALDADAIVLPTHQRSGVGRWMFGSVTEGVARKADIPVLALPNWLQMKNWFRLMV